MISTLALFSILATHPFSGNGLQWSQVTADKKLTISGMLHWDQTGDDARFIVVHDNKNASGARLSFLSASAGGWGKVAPLTLADPKKLASNPGGETMVKDLEAVCRIPDRSDEVLALGNKGDEEGWLFQFKIAGSQAELVDAFRLPDVRNDSDYEGFDLVKVDTQVIAVWADRGTPERAANIWTAVLNGSRLETPTTGTFASPWPNGPLTRPIADLRISKTGDVYVSAASDPGDQGPFDSGVYIIAKLGKPGLTFYSSPVLVSAAPGYKIEAIDFDATGRRMIFATDDEDGGASVAWYQK